MRWPEQFDGPTGMNRFEEMLKPYLKGPCGVSVVLNRGEYCGRLNLADTLVGAPSASCSINYRRWWVATAGI